MTVGILACVPQGRDGAQEVAPLRTLTVGHEPASAGVVRRALADDLAGHGIGRDVCEDVVLLATELVGNAVRYAHPLPGGLLRVEWRVDPGKVLIRVTDGGGIDAPRVREAGPHDTRGRGMAIVDALARDWGVERYVNGVGPVSTVWAELVTVGGNGFGNGSRAGAASR